MNNNTFSYQCILHMCRRRRCVYRCCMILIYRWTNILCDAVGNIDIILSLNCWFYRCGEWRMICWTSRDTFRYQRQGSHCWWGLGRPMMFAWWRYLTRRRVYGNYWKAVHCIDVQGNSNEHAACILKSINWAWSTTPVSVLTACLQWTLCICKLSTQVNYAVNQPI